MMCVGIMAFEFVEFYFLHPGASDRLVMASIMFFVAWLVVIMLGCPFVIAYRRTMPVLTEDERERLFSRLLEGSESSANFFVGIHAVRLMYGAILIGGFLALVLVWAFKR